MLAVVIVLILSVVVWYPPLCVVPGLRIIMNMVLHWFICPPMRLWNITCLIDMSTRCPRMASSSRDGSLAHPPVRKRNTGGSLLMRIRRSLMLRLAHRCVITLGPGFSAWPDSEWACSVPYTASHHTTPHRTAPHHTAPHRTAPLRSAPLRTAPHRPTPPYTARQMRLLLTAFAMYCWLISPSGGPSFSHVCRSTLLRSSPLAFASARPQPLLWHPTRILLSLFSRPDPCYA